MSFARLLRLVLILALLSGCGDNLFPSGDDKRPIAESGTTGPNVGQKAADFSVSDIRGNTVTLVSALSGRKGAVFYFTMWCPICDSHMSNMRTLVPLYPGTGFYLVDYVSGSVSAAGEAAAASGYADGTFTVLADVSHQLFNSFLATMGTTVVVDSSGTILMNEDYRDGRNLTAILDALP